MYAAIARLYDYLAAAHAAAQPDSDNAMSTLDPRDRARLNDF
jgi:hypothetical protein